MIMTRICASVLVGLTAFILYMMATDDGSSKYAIVGGAACIFWLITLALLTIFGIWGL